MTINELSDRINDGITDPNQRAANDNFIKRIHAQLKEGGIWGWPDAQETYRKVGNGFESEEKYANP